MTSEYECTGCKKVFEYVRPPYTNFPEKVPCPECKTDENVKRIFGFLAIGVGSMDKATGQYFAAGLTPTNKIPNLPKSPEYTGHET